MSAVDDAIEAAYKLVDPWDRRTILIDAVVKAVIESGHLIARDDKAGLMAALGLTQVGWHHDGGEPQDCHDYDLHHEDCAECLDCQGVYTLEEQP